MPKEMTLEKFEQIRNNLIQHDFLGSFTFIDRYTTSAGLKFYLFRGNNILNEEYIYRGLVFLALPKFFNSSLPSAPDIRFKLSIRYTIIPNCTDSILGSYLPTYGFLALKEWLNSDRFTDYDTIGQVERETYRVEEEDSLYPPEMDGENLPFLANTQSKMKNVFLSGLKLRF